MTKVSYEEMLKSKSLSSFLAEESGDRVHFKVKV